MKKKIVSLLLALVMLIPVFPSSMKAEAATQSDIVRSAINSYVSSSKDTWGSSYSGKAWGCFALCNYVWKNVFGYDTYAGSSVVTVTTSESKVGGNNLYNFLKNNGAKAGDLLFMHNPCHGSSFTINHTMVIMNYDSTGIWLTDGYESNGKIVLWNNNTKISYTGTSHAKYFSGNCYPTLYKIKDSIWNSVKGSVPLPTVPEAPVISSAKHEYLSTDYITFTWSSVPNATNYHVYMWDDNAGVELYLLDMGMSLSHTCAPMGAGRYHFIVRAGNSAGYSDGGTPWYFTIVDPHTHSWDGGRITTAPTETTTGIRTYTCTGCGATKTEIVPKTPHVHQWDGGRVTKEATVLNKGEMVYTCTGCGQTKTEQIPVLTKADGKCGDNVTWSYEDETKTLTLSGTGPTYSYTPFDSWDSLPFASNAIHYKAEKIIISPGITTIGGRLFDSFSSVTSISIPTSVKLIGQSAFYRWWALKDITIPNGIVDRYAFGGEGTQSRGPGSIRLEEGVTEVGECAFFGYSDASVIYIPKSLKSIGVGAFQLDSVKEIYYGGTESEWKALGLQSRPGFRDDTIVHFAETEAGLTGFSDVPVSEYYAEPVRWAVENNITSGVDRTHFGPGQSCTRAQAVTFLWRAAGEPEPAGGNTGFTDVKAGEYYEKAVRWAVEKGITAGTSATKFSPNAKCTRAQIVTFLWRSAGEPATGGSNAFRDVSSGDYYADAVAWAVRNNITAGTSATSFSPNSRCTRGQIVTFLYRSAQ